MLKILKLPKNNITIGIEDSVEYLYPLDFETLRDSVRKIKQKARSKCFHSFLFSFCSLLLLSITRFLFLSSFFVFTSRSCSLLSCIHFRFLFISLVVFRSLVPSFFHSPFYSLYIVFLFFPFLFFHCLFLFFFPDSFIPMAKQTRQLEEGHIFVFCAINFF